MLLFGTDGLREPCEILVGCRSDRGGDDFRNVVAVQFQDFVPQRRKSRARAFNDQQEFLRRVHSPLPAINRFHR